MVETRRRRTLRGLTRNALKVAVVSVHGLLLWERFQNASILEPVVLAKYLGALLLLTGACLYKRAIPARLQGRRAMLVFWLVALLLHTIAPFSAETRELDGEIVAIVELGLAFPLALVVFALVQDAAISLRAVHELWLAHAIPSRVPLRMEWPARAPPRGC